MNWYNGTIGEAVALSKQRNAIFVVFIEGDNALSVEMAATIDHEDVLKRLSDPSNFLAIKLMSGSTNYTHFAQIYQFVPVPSLFFIGRNGTPLEVVCAGVEPSNLATRIDRILQEHQKDRAGLPSSSDNAKQQTVNLLNSESQPTAGPTLDHAKPEASSEPPKKQQKTHHVEISKSGKEYDVVCDGDVCTRVPRVRMGDPGPSSANVVIHEPKLKMEEPVTSSQPLHTPKSPTETPKPAVKTPNPPVQIPNPPVQSPNPPVQSPNPPVQTPNPPVEIPKPPTEGGNIDDKIEKAKELIEARRREKIAKEKELEKQKELERRSTGQGVSELKQWQADQELKQLQEERKREKMENNLARQRILEQIAQDRAERKARDQPVIVAPVMAAQPTVPLPPSTVGDAGTKARIQFKLPDGASHTADFDAAGTLRDVNNYVADNLQLATSNFSLWTAFPRRELNNPDATLRNLQLTPSAALLVLPRRTNQTVASPSSFATIITFITQIFTTYILEPSQQLYAWICSRINSDPSGPPRPPSEPTEGPRSAIGGPGLRRRGNIHRLGEERSPDDDNNTWNGNSTQQM